MVLVLMFFPLTNVKISLKIVNVKKKKKKKKKTLLRIYYQDFSFI
jgi:hypothetical protein